MPIPQQKILLWDGHLARPSYNKKYFCGTGKMPVPQQKILLWDGHLARPSYWYNVKSNYAELAEQISIVPIPGSYSTRRAIAARTLG
jgi:hypothetical protein